MEEALDNNLVSEMVKAGVVYGHKKSKTHPRMKPYIGANRNEIELLNPGATLAGLEKAVVFLKERLEAGALLLLVGGSPAAKGLIEEWAGELKMPYVTERWLGGTLTNFEVIRGRVNHLKDLREKREKGGLAKYTKKEQYDFAKEIDKLSRFFGSLERLIKKPDVMFVVDIETHRTAVREARQLGIPIVAIVDSNDDPGLVDYPIIANDHARASVGWVFGKIKEGLGEIKVKKDEG